MSDKNDPAADAISAAYHRARESAKAQRRFRDSKDREVEAYRKELEKSTAERQAYDDAARLHDDECRRLAEAYQTLTGKPLEV